MSSESKPVLVRTHSTGRTDSVYLPEDYFILRTPLLPVGRWLQYSSINRSSEEALTELKSLWEDPAVREAVYVSSPSLRARLEEWDWHLRDKKDWKLAGTLYNYASRMATRPTPFGLFAAVSMGRVGERPNFMISRPDQGLRRHTRLDTETVSDLTDHLIRGTDLRYALPLRSNETGRRVADNWHYVDWRVDQGERVYSLSSVQLSESVDLVLQAVREGTMTARQLADLLVGTWTEIAVVEALAFVDELIDSHVILPVLEPCLTGHDSLAALMDDLDGLDVGSDTSRHLDEGLRGMQALDRKGLACTPTDYQEVMKAFSPIKSDLQERNFFQVDLYRDIDDLTLPQEVLDEVARGADVLTRLGLERDRQLESFCQRFTGRYGDQRVSLLEVLDEETGIGLDPESGGDDALLNGVLWQTQSSRADSGSAVERRLLASFMGQAMNMPEEIKLEANEIPELRAPDRAALAPSAHAFVTVLADGFEAVEQGNFQVLMHSVGGPSAANLVGRFCFGLPDLAERVRSSLENEAACQPDAVFAEVVHLPQGRAGNLVRRPLLREYEIPVLGRSGANLNRQIPLHDLDVEVRGQSVLLWSRRLGKRVIPRLSTAHNFNSNALGIYRFLCLLQFHDVARGGFHLGPSFSTMRRFPRVRYGRVILSLARWRVNRAEAKALIDAVPDDRIRKLDGLRSRIKMPQLVSMREGENWLALDLGNPFAVDALCRRLSKVGEVELIEAVFDPAKLCFGNRQTRFVHELVLPLRLKSFESSQASLRARRRIATLERRFLPTSADPLKPVPPDSRHKLPGSDWLYYRIYGTPSQLDRALREVLGPASEEFRADGHCEQWFFIRYDDPKWHLRWRFKGDPSSLNSKVIPKMAAIGAELRRRGWISHLDMATYDREIERYGGLQGMALCERWFSQESRRVTALLAELQGSPRDWRWQTAAWCMLRDLDDLGCSGESVGDFFEWAAAAFQNEFGMSGGRLASLGAKFRNSSSSVARACAGLPPEGADHIMALRTIVAAESAERIAIGQELRALERNGRLWGSFDALVPSLVHMTCNRWFSDKPRANEMVLYDLLRRGLIAQSRRREAQG